MGDLEQLRDHAAFMAAREHVSGCQPVRSRPGKAWTHPQYKWCRNDSAHDEHEWAESSKFTDFELTWKCYGICCQTDAERALWRQIVDEINAYLARGDDGGEGLF